MFASHDGGLVNYYVMRFAYEEGKLVEQGSPAELLLRHDRGNLEEVFLEISRKEIVNLSFKNRSDALNIGFTIPLPAESYGLALLKSLTGPPCK